MFCAELALDGSDNTRVAGSLGRIHAPVAGIDKTLQSVQAGAAAAVRCPPGIGRRTTVASTAIDPCDTTPRSSGRQSARSRRTDGIVENVAMFSPADWHPVAATPALVAGDNLVAARVLGHDLVLWRSAEGVAQAWHDRCPHRGTRLSLGRIVDGRLCCAYHGWEFAADSGRCVAIPALADLAQVPGRVCARTCTVAESQQMVWVRLEPGAQPAPVADRGGEQAGAAPAAFLRSLAVRAPLDSVHAALRRHGFAPDGPSAWRGGLALHAARMFVLCVQADLVFVHAWLCQPLRTASHTDLFAALRRLRSDAETGQA